MLNGKLVKGLEGVAVNHGPLFNPADLVFFGLYLEEAAVVFEHFERLAVDHLGHAIGDGGYPVMEVHLTGGDVDHVVLLMVKPPASTGEREKAQGQECTEYRQRGLLSPDAGDEGDGGDWRSREHSRWRST